MISVDETFHVLHSIRILLRKRLLWFREKCLIINRFLTFQSLLYYLLFLHSLAAIKRFLRLDKDHSRCLFYRTLLTFIVQLSMVSADFFIYFQGSVRPLFFRMVGLRFDGELVS